MHLNFNRAERRRREREMAKKANHQALPVTRVPFASSPTTATQPSPRPTTGSRNVGWVVRGGSNLTWDNCSSVGSDSMVEVEDCDGITVDRSWTDADRMIYARCSKNIDVSRSVQDRSRRQRP